MVWPALAAMGGGASAGGGILASPWLHLGLGVLSGMQSGNVGMGAMSGLNSFNQYNRAALINQQLNTQLKNAQEQAKFREWAAKQLRPPDYFDNSPPPGLEGPPQPGMDRPSRVMDPNAPLMPGPQGILAQQQAARNEVLRRAATTPGMENWALQGMLAGDEVDETFVPLTAAEKEAVGIAPDTFAQRHTTTGRIHLGPSPLIERTDTPPMDKIVEPQHLKNFVNDKGENPSTIMTYAELRKGGYRFEPTPTEGAVNAGYAAQSMRDANRIASEVLADPNFDPTSAIEAFGGLSNWTASPEYQVYRAAADEHTTNVVYLRSGVTAREEERTSAFKNLWPQGGDKPKTVLKKERLRLMGERNAWTKAARAGRVTRNAAELRKKEIAEELKALKQRESTLTTSPASGVIEWDKL